MALSSVEVALKLRAAGAIPSFFSQKYESGEITKEEYDKWRYHYPEYDTAQRWVKVPSQELSATVVEKNE